MSVCGLRVSFARRDGDVTAVRGVDLTLHEGGALGLVGESGSGKSTIAAALMNLVRPPGRVIGGRFA